MNPWRNVEGCKDTLIFPVLWEPGQFSSRWVWELKLVRLGMSHPLTSCWASEGHLINHAVKERSCGWDYCTLSSGCSEYSCMGGSLWYQAGLKAPLPCAQPRQEVASQETTLLKTIRGRAISSFSWQVIFSLDHFSDLLHSTALCKVVLPKGRWWWATAQKWEQANVLLSCILIFCT